MSLVSFKSETTMSVSYSYCRMNCEKREKKNCARSHSIAIIEAQYKKDTRNVSFSVIMDIITLNGTSSGH